MWERGGGGGEYVHVCVYESGWEGKGEERRREERRRKVEVTANSTELCDHF